MTRDEAVALARYIHALCPQQRFDEYTPDVWGDVLVDVKFEDGKRAAVEIARRQPWIAPAEIIAEVKQARNGRLDYFQYEPAPGEIGTQFTRNLRAQIAAVVDGRRPPAVPYVGSPRPVLELTAGIGYEVQPRDQPQTRIRSARDVGCPNPACQAPANRPCKTPSGRRMSGFHGSRTDALKGVA
ncbi:hypothetical protein [Kitasatospora sp. NPDC058046]|uniref:zinc finger domain-containing protein n=1 Tax=Kitasatospora sp. NPDC058046 TaxID=3346312 RepID=UPI0036DAF0AD